MEGKQIAEVKYEAINSKKRETEAEGVDEMHVKLLITE
jgi:hypothetical protein